LALPCTPAPISTSSDGPLVDDDIDAPLQQRWSRREPTDAGPDDDVRIA
jgi:hypothetical protein